MLLIRQVLFITIFYTYMALYCVALVPTLLLPRHIYMIFLRGYFLSNSYLEKYILGLDYEVRGWEHVPQDGRFLIAAKHYSTYETLKLHVLFKDPAIILKRELALIPIWGWLALKAGMIAINRSSGETAMTSIIKGAESMKQQGRPIAIFPQGTRVGLKDTIRNRPYKYGIIRMQDATGLPILPLANNTGVFWPRRAFLAKPGKVILEFFPPIPPGNSKENFEKMVAVIEENSNRLVQEALSKQ